MSKIYVVTKGTYSGYHIITATTDKKLANEIAKRFDGQFSESRTRVETYENAEIYLKPIWIVYFDSFGNVDDIIRAEGADCYQDVGNYDIIHSGLGYVYVQADNEEHAIKIASEKRAEFLARKTGIA